MDRMKAGEIGFNLSNFLGKTISVREGLIGLVGHLLVSLSLLAALLFFLFALLTITLFLTLLGVFGGLQFTLCLFFGLFFDLGFGLDTSLFHFFVHLLAVAKVDKHEGSYENRRDNEIELVHEKIKLGYR